jgi:hypothetical protein
MGRVARQRVFTYNNGVVLQQQVHTQMEAPRILPSGVPIVKDILCYFNP